MLIIRHPLLFARLSSGLTRRGPRPLRRCAAEGRPEATAADVVVERRKQGTLDVAWPGVSWPGINGGI